MDKVSKEYIIGGMLIGGFALVYFLTRNKTPQVVTDNNPVTQPQTTMSAIQAASVPSINLPPVPPNYLTFNFGPSHDLTTLTRDNSPLATLPPQSGPPVYTPAAGGCGCGCEGISFVGEATIPAGGIPASAANVLGVINNAMTNASARIQ